MYLYLGPSGPQSSLPRAPATQPTCRNPGLSKTCGQDSSPLEAVMFAKGPLMKDKETGTRGDRKGSCYKNNDITILTRFPYCSVKTDVASTPEQVVVLKVTGGVDAPQIKGASIQRTNKYLPSPPPTQSWGA